MATATVLLTLLTLAPARADDVEKLRAEAIAALKKGDRKAARELAVKAVQLAPADATNHLFLAQVLDADGRFDDAVAAARQAIRLDPKLADAYQQLGISEFKRGKVKESASAFDKFIELQPRQKAGHWMRGISLYYAGRYDEGKKQFEAYQTTDTNDVENAVWHFLCAARQDGVDKARAGVLKIGKDSRIPMTEVYDLYRGKLKPDDVLAAANAGKVPEEERAKRLFYAHLYLGIYADVTGDKKKAEEHLALAAEKYKIAHYMGDVARVHLQLLRAEKKK
jgi:lipoprotein NlpI